VWDGGVYGDGEKGFADWILRRFIVLG
jgi:hypothetical protein